MNSYWVMHGHGGNGRQGPIGRWIGLNILWVHNHLPNFFPEWAKLMLLASPVIFLSAAWVFWSVRQKGASRGGPR